MDKRYGKKIARKKNYRRFCDDCEELYSPTGKYQRFCPVCREKRIKLRYNKNEIN